MIATLCVYKYKVNENNKQILLFFFGDAKIACIN